MNRNRLLQTGWLLLALAAVPALAFAQLQTVDTSRPIVKSSHPPKPKSLTFQGEVLSSSFSSITVRSRGNARIIRSFSYAPAVRKQIEQILAHGGYQYGDKVAIVYTSGSDIALQIKGKPSAPKKF